MLRPVPPAVLSLSLSLSLPPSLSPYLSLSLPPSLPPSLRPSLPPSLSSSLFPLPPFSLYQSPWRPLPTRVLNYPSAPSLRKARKGPGRGGRRAGADRRREKESPIPPPIPHPLWCLGSRRAEGGVDRRDCGPGQAYALGIRVVVNTRAGADRRVPAAPQ